MARSTARTWAMVTVAFAVAATLTACAPAEPVSTEPTDPPSASTSAPGEPAAPVTPEPAPVPVADEFSQIVDGVLYQGIEGAPVKIGTDVPGQPPADEELMVPGIGETMAKSHNKYLVYVSLSDDRSTYLWKTFGMSRHGSFRSLDSAGYNGSAKIPTEADALAAPKTASGRVLDRSEYFLGVASQLDAGK